MKKYDVIVVGGGISGMSFAHFSAKAECKTLVLEKENRLGGSIHSEQGDDGFWIELGAHTCYNSYRSLLEIIEDCGIASQILPRQKVPFRLWTKNGMKSFFSRINILELLISIPKALAIKKEGETVKSYYGSILGKRNFQRVFSALFSAVPSQNADGFPADALFKKRERRKDIIKHYTMKKGLESIVNTIADQEEIEIKNGVEISTVEQLDTGFLIKTNHGDFVADKLAICTSLPSIPILLATIAPEIVQKTSKIPWKKVESMGIIVRKDAMDLKPFAGLVPINGEYFSAVSRDTVVDENYRGFTFHFKPDVMSREEKKDIVSLVLNIDITKALKIHEKINIVPSLQLGHYDKVREIDGLLTGKNIFLSGNYFAGLSIEDCVSRSKSEVGRMVGK